MEYKMTQDELCEAIQLYLNEQVLKRPVKITSVDPVGYPKPEKGADIALTIVAFDSQEQVENFAETDKAD